MFDHLKKEIFIILLILFYAYLSIGQNRIEKAYQDYRINPKFPNGEIFSINSLNPDVEELIDFYELKSKHGIRYKIIKLIGFVASQTDQQAISFLSNIISDHPLRNYKVEAIHAFLRIGGAPMEQTLKNIFSTENYELQFRSLRYCWMLDDLRDLKIIENLFEEILADQPEWKISNVIKNSLLDKVQTTIEILESSNSIKIEKMLVDMITQKKSYNYTAL